MKFKKTGNRSETLKNSKKAPIIKTININLKYFLLLFETRPKFF